jgi:hypothetical protein
MKTTNIVTLIVVAGSLLWLGWRFSNDRLVWEDLKAMFGRHTALGIVIVVLLLGALISSLIFLP